MTGDQQQIDAVKHNGPKFEKSSYFRPNGRFNEKIQPMVCDPSRSIPIQSRVIQHR